MALSLVLSGFHPGLRPPSSVKETALPALAMWKLPLCLLPLPSRSLISAEYPWDTAGTQILPSVTSLPEGCDHMDPLCTCLDTFYMASTFELAEREQELRSFLADREHLVVTLIPVFELQVGCREPGCVSICIAPPAFKRRSVCGPASMEAVLGPFLSISVCVSLPVFSLVMLCLPLAFSYSSCGVCFLWCQFCCLSGTW